MSLLEKLPSRLDRICLDLDDVLVDFEGGVEKLMLGSKIEDVEEQKQFWNVISFDEETRGRMWEFINKGGPDWWANLEKLPWANDLLSAAKSACDEVVILTSPGATEGAAIAAQGKVRWSIKEFGSNVLCMTSKKYICANKNTLLIDDLKKFIGPWEDSGGIAFKLRKRWESGGHTPYEIIDALNQCSNKMNSAP